MARPAYCFRRSSSQCAEREIRISTPYFVPDPSFLRALIERATHGVSVLLLLPGRHMDHPWVRLVSRRLFDPLLRAGVRIFEYQPSMLHQKLLIVDGRWTLVGTMNLDMMSFEYLDEINLAVIDSAFARTTIEQHEADVQKSVELTLPSWRRNWLEVITAEAVWLAAGQNWVHRLGRTNVASFEPRPCCRASRRSHSRHSRSGRQPGRYLSS